MEIEENTTLENVKTKEETSFSTVLKIILGIIAVMAIFVAGYIIGSKQQVIPNTVNDSQETVVESEDQMQEVEKDVDSNDWALPDTSEKSEPQSLINGVQNFPDLTFVKSDNINYDSFVGRVVVAKTNNFDNVFDSLTAGDVVESAKAEIDIGDNPTRLKDYQSEEVATVLGYYKSAFEEKGYKYIGNQPVFPIRQTIFKQSSDYYFVASDDSSAFVLRHTLLTTPDGALNRDDNETHFIDKEIFEIAYVENLAIEWEEEKFVSPSGRYVASIINGDAYEAECGYLNYNCFFRLVDTTDNTSFFTKLREFPAIGADGTISNHIVRVSEILWTDNDELYLVGGTGDGGYWTIGYKQFDLNNNRAVPVFTANGGECPSRSYSIYDVTYWLQDTNNDYNVCLDVPQETSENGYEVYRVDRLNDFSQTFVQIVPDETSFLNQFAQNLPLIVLNHYKNR